MLFDTVWYCLIMFDTVWYCLMLFDAVWWTLKQRYAPCITEFNGFQWNGLDFNGIQWNGMRTGIQWNGMRTHWNARRYTLECVVGSVGKVCWETLSGKSRYVLRSIIETFISEGTFAFFSFLHFLHFLHLDGCHKASLFLLKFHALFNGSLDSFSTSGRGVPKVM